MISRPLKIKLKSLNKIQIHKIKFQSNDNVIVITGKDKGKIGKILEIKKGNEFVKIENIGFQTHYKKDDGVNKGNITTLERWIHISNISHVTQDGKPTKVRILKGENGEKKKIFSRKTGEELRINMNKTEKVKVEDQETRKEKEELQKIKFEEKNKTADKDDNIMLNRGKDIKKGGKK